LPSDPKEANKTGDRAGGLLKQPPAGQAYIRAVEHDPEAQKALRRVQRRLREIAAVFQSPEFRGELERSRREQQADVARLAEQVRQALRDAGDELAARGLPTPTTLEGWEHLARVIEMPFDTVRTGDYTFRDVFVMALAWLDRQKILRRRTDAAGAAANSGHGKPGRMFTIAALRKLTGLRNATLNKYARLADVRTPRRGERNFRYGAADVGRILNAIITHSSEEALVARCQAALREIAE
jgi:DNA-binding transcriptional MerR regulator